MDDKVKLTNVVKFLQGNRLAVLSTVSEKCTPQAALIYYIVDENYDIYFITTKESKKVKNILKNNSVALVIAQEVEPYELQIEGVAEITQDSNKKITILDKWGKIANDNPASLNWPPLMQLKTDKGMEFVKIHIEWFKYSEFNRESPLIIEGTSEDLH